MKQPSSLNGMVNRHNSVYWEFENPHLIVSQELNAPGVCVWAGIHSTGIIGHFFFESTVNGENYAQMLEEVVLPEVKNSPRFNYPNVIWQQDGAPPHFTPTVRKILDDNFEEWIGRRGKIDWPPRSCDLTPCDFSFVGNHQRKSIPNEAE